MLNKLLKKYMPWQQRGRWVRVYFDALEASDFNDISFRHPDRMTVSVADGGWELNLTFDTPVAVIYAYMTITQVISDNMTESNYIYADPVPGSMMGARGYVDYYVTDVEVI